ncbi:MAG: class I SAM-dependent methyltransferase [Solirubrobacterales bacterium]|nr:class I SAM-dependent methyltransferase [Solirubrobacterales bacterium]
MCPLCSGATSAAFSTPDRNRAVSDERFHYRRCAECGALHLVNVPADLGRFYPDSYFAFPSVEQLRAEAAGPESYRMAIVARHVEGGRLIEIGPGTGNFAVQALDAGFDVAAIEADQSAVGHLRATLGIEVVASMAPQDVLAALGPADAIVAWHVIEHVGEPWAVIAAAAASLRPGGVLVVAMPNPGAFGLRVLGGRWPHVDAPRHLFLLPYDAVIDHARSVGLEPVELTATDPGGLHWNMFSWHWLLRRPQPSALRDKLAHLAGQLIAAALAPIERRGMRGAAYTLVLRKV